MMTPFRFPPFPLLAGLLALLAACLLLPGMGGGFIFDDAPNIVENTQVHLTELDGEDLLYAAYSFQPGSGSRALSMLSFALDHWRGGLDARVFKTTNLLIHVLTTFALALFSRRLLELVQWPPRRAAIGALVLASIWAIHPLQVSSVLYVVQRMQTLVTLFMVLALWAYLCMRQAQMEGRRSRQYGALMGLFWVLGLASKEDAALLPAYTLVLELTVLRFRAAQPGITKWLRRGYLLMTLAGITVFVLAVVPHYWHWSTLPLRDFSSFERLLSQGRALVMYLGQMLLPLPRRLPFFYDNFAVSRSLWQPATTLPALMLLGGLLAWAWCWRQRRPLFAFGVFLFFAGHFMTSNVINLELVFEHRNHLPLIGIVLAMADLCMMAWQRWPIRLPVLATCVAAVMLALGFATVVRAYAWGEPLRFAESSVAAAPQSPRAWLTLCGLWFERSAGEAGRPELDRAIAVCTQGAELTNSPRMLSNLVIFKTIRGDVSQADWDRFLTRLGEAPINRHEKNIAIVTLDNVERGVPLDENGVLQTLDILSARTDFTVHEYLRMGAYIYNETMTPGKAFPYLRRAVELSPADDPRIDQLLAELDEVGRHDWVEQLQRVERGPAVD